MRLARLLRPLPALMPGPALAHAAERMVILTLPTGRYILGAALAVALTALAGALAPRLPALRPRHARRVPRPRPRPASRAGSPPSSSSA